MLTENEWVVGGPTNNGGILLRWLRDEFGAQEKEVAKRLGVDPYDLLTQYAARVPAGSEGLLFCRFYQGSGLRIGMRMRVEHFWYSFAA